MIIWNRSINLKELNDVDKDSLQRLLQIRFTHFDDRSLSAEMPITDRARQPLGSLHGGISCFLSETVAATASSYCIDVEKKITVGLEINANHVRKMTSGVLTVKAESLKLGKKIHIWDVRIRDGEEKLICISRFTAAVLSV